jgi:hypothetical protein
MCQVCVRNVLCTDVSCQYVFRRACFNVLKIKKFKHACLRHITRLAHRVKCICVYTCLIRINTYSTYKFNKFQTKLKKYIKNQSDPRYKKYKIDVSYLEISYRLEWSWSLISVSNRSFKHTNIVKIWYAKIFYTHYTHVYML